MVSLDVVDFRISDQVVDPDLNVEAHVYAAELNKRIEDDSSSKEIQRLMDSGGWIEILDTDRSVIRQIGVKQDAVTYYSESELYAGLENRSDSTYYYSISPYAAERCEVCTAENTA